ncbi:MULTISPECIES: MarR family winged helix-turn-helix transcriptional regulator [Neisseria]|uniref:MarR family protein n=1 Tax=Neisseria musculi TaxID=1815583 RepID=A0A7H1MA57_9NEIS|nr:MULTISPECIES: MarR family transcriptional regulator [Neisseria]MBF0803098.1 MarR family transcriptional regulator [Neisseria sp. 19428wB4_WF04]QNT58522.1 marR family protein [Neisseria musculi]TFU44223.1 MarR family transcriptional regulator [Neisseria sp. WF04]
MEAEQSAGYLINHLARQFAILLSERLKPLDLAPAQFPILLHLWKQDGLSQHELVEKAELRQATIANTLARMERDNLIVRVAHPNDARVRLIKLTEKSKTLEQAATEIAQTINQQALSVLDENERQQFLLMMQKIIAQQKKMMGNHSER